MRPNQFATTSFPRPRPHVVHAAFCAAIVIGGAPAFAAPPAPVRPRPVVDHDVVPAGGAACMACRDAHCRIHGGHLAACRDGACAPYCPVRPAEYGFYRTQWRRWPGQGVLPVSAESAATPVSPPAALVPSADEESPVPPPGATPPPGGGDDATNGASDAATRVRQPVEPAADDPPKKSDALPPADGRNDVPAVEPADAPAPAPRAEDKGSLDRTVPSRSPPVEAVTVEPAGLRYPDEVGRSLAAGVSPWRLQPAGRQRPADSVRGL